MGGSQEGRKLLCSCRTQIGFCYQDQRYQPSVSQGSKSFATFPIETNQQWSFHQLNKATVNMLRICEPYVTWGVPNLKSVRELIYKRGFLKVEGKRTPITSNDLVENNLGRHGVICVEDIIHEVFTVGPNFKYVSNTLWPFKLNTPTGGWRKKTNHFVEGGDFGNREDKIDASFVIWFK